MKKNTANATFIQGFNNPLTVNTLHSCLRNGQIIVEGIH
jgi:hypothetical protein